MRYNLRIPEFTAVAYLNMPMQERGVPRLFTDELVSVDASGPSPADFAVGSPDWPSTTAAIIRDRFQTTVITVFDAKQLRTCIDEALSKDNFHSLHHGLRQTLEAPVLLPFKATPPFTLESLK